MSDDISIPSPTYRVPRHSSGMDPATRKLALIAAGIGGILLVVAGGWTMLGHRSHGVPVVQADSGPLRVKPTNPGGLQIAGAGNEIFSGGSDTDVEKLAPPPETPDPQGLRAAPPPQPAAVAAAPATAPIAASQAMAPLAATKPPAAIGATRMPVPAAAPIAAAARPMVAAVAPPAIATAAPPSASTAAPPAKPAEKPAAAGAAEHGAGGKGALVQLAALSSEPAARAEWERMVKRWPELFGGHQPAFSKIEHGGQVFWRVRTGGFDGAAQATMFCERLRAKGGGCSVADF
ncbi:MAG: SPOR domain-containing protein [Acetobacteraceae bacterium]